MDSGGWRGESSVSSAKYFEYFVQCKSTQLHIQRVQFREEQEDMGEYRANTGEKGIVCILVPYYCTAYYQEY